MSSSEMTETDIFRDTPVRLLGYANEVGEAFRALVDVKWVRLSYGIAAMYVLADTVDKSYKTHKKVHTSEASRNKQVMVTAVDTLMWQTLASIAIPGFTINRLCALSLYTLKHTTKLPKPTRKWITTGIGLACIPFIVKPIDSLTDFLLDETFRKYTGHYK